MSPLRRRQLALSCKWSWMQVEPIFRRPFNKRRLFALNWKSSYVVSYRLSPRSARQHGRIWRQLALRQPSQRLLLKLQSAEQLIWRQRWSAFEPQEYVIVCLLFFHVGKDTRGALSSDP